MKQVHMVAFLLLVVGGLNWLLIGLFNWGIDAVVGMQIAKIIYILVGLSAIYEVATHWKRCKECSSGGTM